MSTTVTHPGQALRPSASSASGPRRAWPWADALIYLGIAAAVAAAWWIVRVTGLRAASELNYWLGVAGGSMMTLLFAYPLRKRFRFMARWGAAKWWFVVHMLLGIGGPLLVLVHSTFAVGSLNAGVALYSMLIVAASGVVGRFLYLRVHKGLNGERQSLTQLQQALGLKHEGMHSALAFARDTERELLAFEAWALDPRTRLPSPLRAFTLLPLRRLLTRQRCWHALRLSMHQRAQAQGWDAREQRRALRLLRRTVEDYLQAVQRVAQFQSAARLFSLWHVLHVPFVYLMVLCAIAHVVAVHAY